MRVFYCMYGGEERDSRFWIASCRRKECLSKLSTSSGLSRAWVCVWGCVSVCVHRIETVDRLNQFAIMDVFPVNTQGKGSGFSPIVRVARRCRVEHKPPVGKASWPIQQSRARKRRPRKRRYSIHNAFASLHRGVKMGSALSWAVVATL